MSERSWTRLERGRLSRRAMLGLSARMGLGAAGLALVGCGDDDDEVATTAATAEPDPQAESQTEAEAEAQAEAEPQAQAQAEPEPDAQAEPEPPPEPQSEADEPDEQAARAGPAATIVVREVVLDGAEGSFTIANLTSDPVSLEGWFICQRPSYWPLPAIDLAAGESIVLHAAAGENSERDFFASGGFSALGGNGEVGVYRDANFGSAGSIVAYVAWGSGGGRRSVAQTAGIWGGENLAAEPGDVIRRGGDGAGLAAYSVA